MEMMITVTIVSILAAVAIPNYGRVIERGYWREAQDVLRTVYAGQQVYFTVNDSYLNSPTTLSDWRQIYMDDPNLASIPVTFTATAAGSGTGATFTATASRGGGQNMTIDDLNNVCTGPPDTLCGTWPQP